MLRSNWSSGFAVNGRQYGGADPVYVIAEIGTNHACDMKQAENLIRGCAEAGADAVKFQSWTASGLQNSKDVQPDGRLTESQAIPILKKYQIPDEWHRELKACCRDHGVDFLSTPFDPQRARLLREVGVSAIKIASGDLTYHELLQEVGTYGLPIFLSTGMATLGEIEEALDALGPGREKVILLHCVGAYPPHIESANLLAVRTLMEAFGLPIGVSDHFLTNETVLAGVSLGAAVVEKHVTLSRAGDAPDSSFALEVEDFAAMVKTIRLLEKGLGDGIKRCQESEAGGLTGGRRSIFASADLEPGSILTREDLAVVRPNVGDLQPKDLERLLGRRVRIRVPCGAPLRWEDLEG